MWMIDQYSFQKVIIIRLKNQLSADRKIIGVIILKKKKKKQVDTRSMNNWIEFHACGTGR